MGYIKSFFCGNNVQYLTGSLHANLSTAYSYALQGWLSSKNTDSNCGAQEWEQLHYGDNLLRISAMTTQAFRR